MSSHQLCLTIDYQDHLVKVMLGFATKLTSSIVRKVKKDSHIPEEIRTRISDQFERRKELEDNNDLELTLLGQTYGSSLGGARQGYSYYEPRTETIFCLAVSVEPLDLNQDRFLQAFYNRLVAFVSESTKMRPETKFLKDIFKFKTFTKVDEYGQKSQYFEIGHIAIVNSDDADEIKNENVVNLVRRFRAEFQCMREKKHSPSYGTHFREQEAASFFGYYPPHHSLDREVFRVHPSQVEEDFHMEESDIDIDLTFSVTSGQKQHAIVDRQHAARKRVQIDDELEIPRYQLTFFLDSSYSSIHFIDVTQYSGMSLANSQGQVRKGLIRDIVGGYGTLARTYGIKRFAEDQNNLHLHSCVLEAFRLDGRFQDDDRNIQQSNERLIEDTLNVLLAKLHGYDGASRTQGARGAKAAYANQHNRQDPRSQAAANPLSEQANTSPYHKAAHASYLNRTFGSGTAASAAGTQTAASATNPAAPASGSTPAHPFAADAANAGMSMVSPFPKPTLTNPNLGQPLQQGSAQAGTSPAGPQGVQPVTNVLNQGQVKPTGSSLQTRHANLSTKGAVGQVRSWQPESGVNTLNPQVAANTPTAVHTPTSSRTAAGFPTPKRPAHLQPSAAPAAPTGTPAAPTGTPAVANQHPQLGQALQLFDRLLALAEQEKQNLALSQNLEQQGNHAQAQQVRTRIEQDSHTTQALKDQLRILLQDPVLKAQVLSVKNKQKHPIPVANQIVFPWQQARFLLEAAFGTGVGGGAGNSKPNHQQPVQPRQVQPVQPRQVQPRQVQSQPVQGPVHPAPGQRVPVHPVPGQRVQAGGSVHPAPGQRVQRPVHPAPGQRVQAKQVQPVPGRPVQASAILEQTQHQPGQPGRRVQPAQVGSGQPGQRVQAAPQPGQGQLGQAGQAGQRIQPGALVKQAPRDADGKYIFTSGHTQHNEHRGHTVESGNPVVPISPEEYQARMAQRQAQAKANQAKLLQQENLRPVTPATPEQRKLMLKRAVREQVERDQQAQANSRLIGGKFDRVVVAGEYRGLAAATQPQAPAIAGVAAKIITGKQPAQPAAEALSSVMKEVDHNFKPHLAGAVKGAVASRQATQQRARQGLHQGAQQGTHLTPAAGTPARQQTRKNPQPSQAGQTPVAAGYGATGYPGSGATTSGSATLGIPGTATPPTGQASAPTSLPAGTGQQSTQHSAQQSTQQSSSYNYGTSELAVGGQSVAQISQANVRFQPTPASNRRYDLAKHQENLKRFKVSYVRNEGQLQYIAHTNQRILVNDSIASLLSTLTDQPRVVASFVLYNKILPPVELLTYIGVKFGEQTGRRKQPDNLPSNSDWHLSQAIDGLIQKIGGYRGEMYLYPELRKYDWRVTQQGLNSNIEFRGLLHKQVEFHKTIVLPLQSEIRKLVRDFFLNIKNIKDIPSDFYRYLQVNVVGYWASFTNIEEMVALIFGEELERQREKLTKQTEAAGQYSLTSGKLAAQAHKEEVVSYFTNNTEIRFRRQKCSIEPFVVYLDLPHQRQDSLVNREDNFADVFLYNFLVLWRSYIRDKEDEAATLRFLRVGKAER